jgi:hemerythrin-like domain-containing protein
MERCLQEMMKHLLAGQAEMKADINAQVAAHQNHLKQHTNSHTEALQ